MLIAPPYAMLIGLVSRSISFENPTGAVGAGGTESSPLGRGRKGSAVRHVADGETILLADIKGNGTIRHIWMTTHNKPHLLRGALIRIFWDEQPHPSIELPVGDFFGFALGMCSAFQTAIHSVSSTKGMNMWAAMPFTCAARIEFVNQSGARLPLFYQIDYTLGDQHGADVGRLHGWFNRENPTTLRCDFEILPERHARLRFLGTTLGIRPHDPLWWGEGEVKIFIDDDAQFATIVGTGTEDYVGHAFGIQDEAFLYNGCNYREKPDVTDTGAVSIYRWHIDDPVVCAKRMRVTVQQIGHRPTYRARSIDDYKAELYERTDDWSSAALWYEAVPSAPLPTMIPAELRLAGIEIPA